MAWATRIVTLRVMFGLIEFTVLLLLDTAMSFVKHCLCISQLVAHHIEVGLQSIQKLDHLLHVLATILTLVFLFIGVRKFRGLVVGRSKGWPRHLMA